MVMLDVGPNPTQVSIEAVQEVSVIEFHSRMAKEIVALCYFRNCSCDAICFRTQN